MPPSAVEIGLMFDFAKLLDRFSLESNSAQNKPGVSPLAGKSNSAKKRESRNAPSSNNRLLKCPDNQLCVGPSPTSPIRALSPSHPANPGSPHPRLRHS